ncbi:hypothetical protein D9615_006201 [Tricholomella constricta]|uniref:Gag protein n=1 Tax=Tricholomella constricta TaxID=117010 RepID=A0A8H5HB82_9AGAR|nr:hypothetical protein D9615_006201 [Tricholomella constricta]
MLVYILRLSRLWANTAYFETEQYLESNRVLSGHFVPTSPGRLSQEFNPCILSKAQPIKIPLFPHTLAETPNTMTGSTMITETRPHIQQLPLRHQFPSDKPRLDLSWGDFSKWTRTVQTGLRGNLLLNYVFDPIVPKPDALTQPIALTNWIANDSTALAYIEGAVADTELDGLVTDKGAKSCYDDLKTRAQRGGPIRQIGILQDALKTYCSPSEPLGTTAKTINALIDRAFDMGTVNRDVFKSIALLNSLGSDKSYESLQVAISTALSNSTIAHPFTHADVVRQMEAHQFVLNQRTHQTPHETTALAAKAHPPHGGCPHCSNCALRGFNPVGHTQPWCIHEGGGMAGKTIEESRAARLAQGGGGRKTAKKNTSASTGTSKIKVSRGDTTLYLEGQNAETALAAFFKDTPSGQPKVEFAGLATDPTPMPTADRGP